MAFEEGGSRIDDLKLIVSRVAYAASLFDDDGIEVRFMNSRVEGNGLRTEQEAMALVQQVKFSGLTPLGTALNNKVIEPLILGPARANRLKKPVLVIAQGGEDRYQIVKVIVNAVRTLASTRYGADAISLQLAQVGNDMKARAFLEEIDVHPEVGPMVDMMLGGIDSSYDTTDEK
ncbi:SPOSA6832_03562, partial [Sporobolomyces salmonicolor]